ncbi:MAG: enoyl-CoA hydratase/isomerase family protein [Spirochaetes bacterium]|nr:enoyl-CoA hydratase/isomerase family protein [Spirochaetota bacterium]
MEYRYLEATCADDVGIITIRRPPANALSYGLVMELKDLVTKIRTDAGIRSVIFRSGVDKFFSSGADLTDLPPDVIAKLADIPAAGGLKQLIKNAIPSVSSRIAEIFREVHEVFGMIESMPKPTIAVINGHALGGGLELAMACDFRFMGRGSGTVGMPEITLGLIPLGGGTQRLPRLVGRNRAVELLLSGSKIGADEALSIGLATRVCDKEKIDEEALGYAKKLANGPTVSIGLIKYCVNNGLNGPLRDGLKIERDSFQDLLKTEDMIEGILSFVEKREPHFIGK